jgi:hypothetical protein
MVSHSRVSLLLRQELAHLGLVAGGIDGPKAHMREARDSMTVYEHTRGHTLYLVEFRKLPAWIETHFEWGVKSPQEFVRIGSIPIEIHGNNLEPLCSVRVLQNFHPWE